MKTIYQVVTKNYDIVDGVEYLNPSSPFSKNIAYEDFDTALMVAKGLYNIYSTDDSFVQSSECTETDDSFIGIVNLCLTKSVITIEKVELVGYK
jgi:hypothetical protein